MTITTSRHEGFAAAVRATLHTTPVIKVYSNSVREVGTADRTGARSYAIGEGHLAARLRARGWAPRGLPYDPRPAHAYSWPA